MTLPVLLIALGLLFLIGLAADEIGRRTRLPRVTLLLICGIVVGTPGFNVIPDQAHVLYEFLSVMALAMVAFLLGSALNRDALLRHGKAIMSVSAMIVVVTVIGVSFGLWLVGVPAPAALLLGAIATATAPAATRDALHQANATGPFADQIEGIVAVDDAWGLMAFSLAAVLAHGLNGGLDLTHLVAAAWEIGGAITLGVAIGLPASYLSGRLSKGEPLMTEALGIVFLTAGLALWMEVSFLLAGMTAGAVIANLARHHERAFHEIEHVQWPFLIMFFVLAGASLDLTHLTGAGMIGLTYVTLRIITRVLGGWLGGALVGAPRSYKAWYGMALMPQAGVAVGMALVAAQDFPDFAGLILSLTIATTVVFELIGPITTMVAVRRAEIGQT